MEDANISKSATAFGLSLVLASLVNALLVVAKEKSPAVMSALQRMTGHHWISHAAIVLAVFVVAGWAGSGLGINLAARRLIALIVSGVAAAAMIIWGFYLING